MSNVKTKINWELVARLKTKGLTDQDVADVLGKHRVSISRGAGRYLYSREISDPKPCSKCGGVGKIPFRRKVWGLCS